MAKESNEDAKKSGFSFKSVKPKLIGIMLLICIVPIWFR